MAFLITEDRGPVRWVTMSNVDHKNAVPPEGWEELSESFAAFEASEQRVLVLTGEGEDFCAGADIGATFIDLASAAENARRMRIAGRAALALHRLSKPTVAAVDGVAVGAGMNMAIGCDVVIASQRARFAEIFARRGLTLDFGGTWLLPRLVGLSRAREIALTGRMIEAVEAYDIGLITRVVADEELATAAGETAMELSAGAPLAQRFIKGALDRSSSMTFEQALAFEEQAQSLLLASEDVTEGAAAFLQHRPPRFSGR